MLERPPLPDTRRQRVITAAKRGASEVVHLGLDMARELGAIGPHSRRARRFGAFGAESVLCFPVNAVHNERYIHIGKRTVFGPNITLSAGMAPGQTMVSDPVVKVGDRCLIGKGSSIVGHYEIVIGDDVWTGYHVYITDQNHGYDDPRLPISRQAMRESPVSIGDGSWLGHGAVVLPGVSIGQRAVIGANSVVTRDVPDRCIAAGVPARVIKELDDDETDDTATPRA